MSQVSLIMRWLLNSETDTNRQIPAEFIPTGSRTIRNEIHKIIDSKSNKGELPEEWKESAILPLYKKDVKSECSTVFVEETHV
jgi:hypothetical protein